MAGAKCSTTTAHTKIADDIRMGMENQQLTLVMPVINGIEFEILFEVLRSINISPAVIDWFRSYLCEWWHRVRNEDNFSTCDVLSPHLLLSFSTLLVFTLFLLFIFMLIVSKFTRSRIFTTYHMPSMQQMTTLNLLFTGVSLLG